LGGSGLNGVGKGVGFIGRERKKEFGTRDVQDPLENESFGSLRMKPYPPCGKKART